MTRFPNVSERVKEASARTLRAVFAGIGQALLASDRARRMLNSAPGTEGAPQQEGAEGAPQQAAPDAVPIPVRRPTAVKTATETPVEPAAKPATVPAAGQTPAKTTAAPVAKPGANAALGVKPATSAQTPTQPPIPNYDELSFASLRARLRGRDVAQVRQLLSYEKARGSRSNVITMYERRIAKLTETDG